MSNDDSPEVWAEVIGPVYSLAGAARRLGLSMEEVIDRVIATEVWALTTTDGVTVFPASQFTEADTVIEGLPEILRIFEDAGEAGWTLASALNSQWDDLGGRTVLEWLREEPESTPLTATQWARNTAHRWSH